MEEAEKVDVKDEEETLDIRVKDQSGEELFFKVKPHTQMGKSLIHLEKSWVHQKKSHACDFFLRGV